MGPKKALERGLTKALTMQRPLAKKNVARLRRLHPKDSPRDLVRRLDRHYLTTVTGTGTAAGAVALVPTAGIAAALADTVAFTEVTVLYVLSLAEVHQLDPEDFERRQLLVLTVLLGDSAIGALNKTVERTGGYWAKLIVNKIPMSAINKANKVLGPRFITKYGTKQGVLVLGKQVPFGVGAVIGGSGNHLFGRACMKSARKIFGPPPKGWPAMRGDTSDGPGGGSTAELASLTVLEGDEVTPETETESAS
jgi:hypothetical protein